MSKTLLVILILLLGLALGALGMFLCTMYSLDLQALLCQEIITAAKKDVWANVQFPEYKNPFEETTVNPFEGVYTNPFEKLGE